MDLIILVNQVYKLKNICRHNFLFCTTGKVAEYNFQANTPGLLTHLHKNLPVLKVSPGIC